MTNSLAAIQSDLTICRAVRQLSFWVCCTLFKEQSQWRTDFPEWCFRCCLEEGRADRQSFLSLINKPQRWSGEMPLFDKQVGHCLRISTEVKWPERGDVRRVTDTVAWMEDVLWSWDPPSPVLQSESRVRFSPVYNGQSCPKYLFVVKCFSFQDFLLKVVSCRSGSTQRHPNHDSHSYD